MPPTYLLVQISDTEYVPSVLSKINEDVRAKCASKVLVITRIADKRKALKVKKSLRECFPGFDMDKNLKEMGAMVTGLTYNSMCQDVYEFL